MKGLVLVTGDDALKAEAQAYFTGLGYRFSNEVPVERAPDWALAADLGLLAPLASGLANQDLARHFGQVVALADTDGFHARLQAARLGASGFLRRPLSPADLFDRLEDGIAWTSQDPIRVLIIDDDPIAARVTGRQMEMTGMATRQVEDPAQVLEALRDFRPDIAIVDLYMPQCSGTELAQVIRQIDTFDSLPIIFLSSEAELAAQMTAVSIGGDDFVAKGTPAALMVPLIRSRAERMRRLRRHLANDGMTRLLTHTAFKERLDETLRRDQSVCLALCDIDSFRAVNAEHGHPIGDVVIKTLSRLLRHRSRPGDEIGRFGGEEFALLLPATPLDEAAAMVENMRAAFAELAHSGPGGRFHASFSAGLTRSRAGESVEELVRRTLAALGRAKDQGRNRLVKDEA
ncbi:diguanylate cyclase domain-containing protein [Magnetospirillum aberrantis]|uniref:diguanylate cyclase n=1 Tax=Magnetospirillum aberrantis SpK TaxID=908842 RepID=A0A7C9UXK1_9PROT|nr:diguanylate cyclase [Magnetospirillum aberrantis]NFV81110.1 diguanylate cyclase [Magnetospirillum aberrantis SpK]